MQSKDLRDHQFIVFGNEHYNPLGAIRSLGEEGIPSVFVSLKGRWSIAEKSKYLTAVYHVDSFDEGMEKIVKLYGDADADKLPFIITCDDKTMQYLDERYEQYKDRFIIFNAGVNGRITKYMDKFEILKIAEKHGLKILRTEIVDRGIVPENLEYPVITKSISPTVGGWKKDVFICNSENELKSAFEKISSPQVLIQKYIDKKNEYCLDGYGINGGRDNYITIESTYNYLIPGYYSPYMTVKNFYNPEMERGINNMMADIGYEGIWCIEFLIDQDDTYYFTEVNFRNSGWSYASTIAGMNMLINWSQAYLDGKIDVEKAYSKVPDGFTAMVEPIDYQKRVVERNVEFAKWLRDFKEMGCGFYYSKDDPEPFDEMIRNWKHLN